MSEANTPLIGGNIANIERAKVRRSRPVRRTSSTRRPARPIRRRFRPARKNSAAETR
ncbi:MAG: hypothetical protein ACLUI3_09370 [Christensenellales bacterium]